MGPREPGRQRLSWRSRCLPVPNQGEPPQTQGDATNKSPEVPQSLLNAINELRTQMTAKATSTEGSTVAKSQDIEVTKDSKTEFQLQQENQAKATIELLTQLGGGKVNQEQGIKYVPGTAIGLPTDPRNMDYETAAELLTQAAEDQKQLHNFRKTFPYRPYDGAAAFERALVKVFGLAAQGKTVYTFFGPERPYRVDVPVGVNETISVPWGTLDFPMFQATVEIEAARDRDLGIISAITITAPKKFTDAINGLWKVVLEELKERSIFKGKAFYGSEEPKFFNPWKVKREQVVYSENAERRLETSVWGPIRTAQLQRDEGLALNTKNLLAGPYGTGKTLGLLITAQEAVTAGWTFIQSKSNEDLKAVLQMAVMYSPAVVAIEDIDLIADDGSDKKLADLLELFDGMTMKNNEVMVVMTTNHAEDLPKGMLRAGRIDSLIEIGSLDQNGVERLIKSVIPESKLDPDTDYAAVYGAMEGFAPAFIKETFSSAQRAAIVRTGSREYLLSTPDFENAALILRAQHEMHEKAGEIPAGDPLEALFERLVQRALDNELPKYEVLDYDGDKAGDLRKSEK